MSTCYSLNMFSLLALVLAIWPGLNSVEAIPINQLRASYPPISDAWLRTLLGYGEDEEPRSLLLFHRPATAASSSSEGNANAQLPGVGTAQIYMAKRKNAELVNHILKNFASINRLGDAGK